MPKTLESKPVEGKLKCKTPHDERNGTNHHCLGNVRWSSPPAIPGRVRSQQVVRESEFLEAASLLRQYKAAQEVRTANNIQALAEHIERLERARDLPGAELAKRQLANCDHNKFLAAQEELVALESDAASLVKVILDRLLVSFHEELSEYCCQRESDLIASEIPLFTDTMIDGNPVRTWELWTDKIAVRLHSCREVTRNLRMKFDCFGTYSAREINSMFAISALVFLTSDESTSFGWL